MDIPVVLMQVDGTVKGMMVDNASFDKLRKIIGCRLAELITLDDNNMVMIDEEGLLAEKEINKAASIMLQNYIVGDVLVVTKESLDRIPYKLGEES